MGNVSAGIIWNGKDLAWFTENASEVFDANITIYCTESPYKGQYKFTDGVTQLSGLDWLGKSQPVLGFGELAFGDQVTGVLTSDPNIVAITNVGGNSSRGYVQAYGAQVGNLAGYPFVRADQVKGFTFLEIEGNTGIGFYTTSGTLRGEISSDLSTKWYSGVVATDYSIRIDAAGAKIGPYSQAGVANNYAFEVLHWNTGTTAFAVYANSANLFSAFGVSGIGVQVTYYLGELGIIRTGFGIGEKMTWGDINARISTVMGYNGAYYSDITYTARSHQFTGYTSIVASNNPLVVYQDTTSSSSTGKFFKASNGDNTPVLRVNRGDGTTLTPGPNILSTISFGLSDGTGVFSSIDDRVLICAEYSSVFTPGNNATVFTDFFVQNYNAGSLAERFRVTPFGIRLSNGSAPASPVNGDIWFDGTDIKMRIGGVTKTFTLT